MHKHLLSVGVAAGIALSLQGQATATQSGWFGTSSPDELTGLLEGAPWRILELVNVRGHLVHSWDPELWPVGTDVQVVAIEFNGEWGVIVEALDDAFYECLWAADRDATPVPFLTISDFFKNIEPLEVTS